MAAAAMLAQPKRSSSLNPVLPARAGPAHVANVLNPLATTSEIKVAERAFRQGASSVQIRAEVEALKQRTAELQALKSDSSSKKIPRRVLKAQRDEIKEMISKVNSEMTLAPSAAHTSAPTAASRAAVARARGTRGAGAAAALRPELRELPPVLDPTALVPDDVKERFRAEYREKQRQEAAAELERAEQERAQRRAAAVDGAVRQQLSLEEFRVVRGVAPRTPPDPKAASALVHGVRSRQPFVQFGAAQTLPDEASSPTGKRRVACG